MTVGNESHVLAEPFFVLATQNPIENEGTYPLPEAQLDRFMFKLLVPFPSKKELKEIVQLTEGIQQPEIQRQFDGAGSGGTGPCGGCGDGLPAGDCDGDACTQSIYP